jgi:SAM-dependent methyltransferase
MSMETVRPEWLPADADAERPSIARMYDFFLGGTRHMEVDREVARAAVAAAPGIKLLIWQNRKFLKRVARYAVELGIDQYLDLGSGIPARGNLHSAVQAVNPQARVVYLDIDPVAVARGEELLAGNEYAVALRGDITAPETILAEPKVRGLLDFDRPVALLLLNVLHFLPFDSVEPAVARLRDALAPGSLLAISHGTADLGGDDPTGITNVYAGAFGHMAMRTYDQVAALFGDFDLVTPGIVDLPDWRGEPSGIGSQIGPVNCYAGAAIKR